MNKLQILLKRELYRRSLYDFVKDFWNTCDPSKFIDNDLIQFYCEIYQYMCRSWTGYTPINVEVPKASEDVDVIDVRQDKSKICIMVPPRHTKSMIFNVFGPTWTWLSYPVKAVSISHTGALASEMNSKRRAIIDSEEFQELFENIKLLADSSSYLKDSRGGELRSLSRNVFTGYGGDIIVNDDLTSAETARKDRAEMESAWSYYRNTMPSRINDISKCIIMNIQQRLAPNDIAGHIMADPKLAAQYIFVTIPAIFEKETYWVYPISGKIKHFKPGDFLWPERFGDYESLRYDVGESIFQTQYLQKPIASDKTIIKPDLIIEMNQSEVPQIEDADMIYASHDFPVKDKESSDYLGSVLAYKVGTTLYIKDCLEKKMAFTKSVEYVEQLDSHFPGIIQVIEDKANGSPILQQLQDRVPGMQPYQPGTASKTQRLESASLYMQAGNIIFIKSVFDEMTNAWSLSESLRNLKTRLLNFPFVKHDDIVDAFSQLLLFVYLDKRFSVYGRAFNDRNIVDANIISGLSYTTIFFNKEGDMWKVAEIAVKYGEETKLVVLRENQFKASINDGLLELKKFAPNKFVFIDCSATDALTGFTTKVSSVERYEIEDFDKSVAQLNLAFDKKRILLDKECRLMKADIETFKFNKSKDENVKYLTTKDGFVALLRIALHYYGGII